MSHEYSTQKAADCKAALSAGSTDVQRPKAVLRISINIQ